MGIGNSAPKSVTFGDGVRPGEGVSPVNEQRRVPQQKVSFLIDMSDFRRF
jgi:hypothetical protein